MDVVDEDWDVQSYINLLILGLELTYVDFDEENKYIPFAMPDYDVPQLPIQDYDRYYYYDLQDTVYK